MEASGLTHRVDAGGVLRIVFDLPGERVNLLDARTLEELNRLIGEATQRDDIQAVLFLSAKPRMFVAGLDVSQIDDVDDAYAGSEAARYGQSIMRKIEESGLPSACAIGGVCLGAGTELALACSFRVAADDPAVSIGLPEIRLGIIPGFGGTQRLPRLVGIRAALDLILTGRKLGSAQALKVGLVDRVAPREYLERETLDLLRRATDQGTGAVSASLRPRKSISRLATERIGPLRRLVFDQARKRVEKRISPRDYPAPARAIEAIEAAMTQPVSQGYDLEARLIGELIPTRTSKNLIWLFKNRSGLKGDLGAIRATPRPVRRMAVLGAGAMGGGIARLAADRGIPVRLKDTNYEAILATLRTAHGVWNEQVDRKQLSRAEVARRSAFIAPTLDDSGLVHADLVVEAVVEDLGVKREVLAEVEQRVSERAVFASNTSSLPITDIAARSIRPGRVIGLHFFNPVHRMPLVEVVAGRHSSPEAVATAHAFALRLGKVPVIVKDGPGFLVNRILALYLNEATRILLEGVKLEALDHAMLGFGMPVGPFALLDQIGLSTARHVGLGLQAAFGERAGDGVAVLDAVIADGREGRRNGRGFYRYRDGERTIPDPRIRGLIGAPAPRDLPAETLQERLVLAMVNEAALCLQEGVVAKPRDVDVAMVLGAGFPPFRGGLLRYADEQGIPTVADRLQRLADAHGERFRPPGSLLDMVRAEQHFYVSR